MYNCLPQSVNNTSKDLGCYISLMLHSCFNLFAICLFSFLSSCFILEVTFMPGDDRSSLITQVTSNMVTIFNYLIIILHLQICPTMNVFDGERKPELTQTQGERREHINSTQKAPGIEPQTSWFAATVQRRHRAVSLVGYMVHFTCTINVQNHVDLGRKSIYLRASSTMQMKLVCINLLTRVHLFYNLIN